VQTSFAIAVAVRPTYIEPRFASEEAYYVSEKYHKRLAIEVFDLFLTELGKVVYSSMTSVASQDGVICGKPALSIRPSFSNHWCGLVTWWTDGESLAFLCGKSQRGPLAPPVLKDWF